MAHPLPDKLPDFPGFTQTKTLFLPSPGKLGYLLTPHGKTFRQRVLNFDGPQAALAWCLANGAGFVFWQSANPERN